MYCPTRSRLHFYSPFRLTRRMGGGRFRRKTPHSSDQAAALREARHRLRPTREMPDENSIDLNQPPVKKGRPQDTVSPLAGVLRQEVIYAREGDFFIVVFRDNVPAALKRKTLLVDRAHPLPNVVRARQRDDAIVPRVDQ